MDIAVKRRRLALCAFFLLFGISIAAWVTRTPAIRDAIGASIAEMGMVLFGLSVGSMVGILSSGWLLRRLGARRTTQIGLWLVVLSLATMSVGVLLGQGPVVAFGLFLFGLGGGGAEIALNIEGAEVEAIAKRPLIHALHGFFSLGTVVGGAVGLFFNAIHFSVIGHLLIIAAIDIAIIVTLIRYIPADTGRAGIPGSDTPAAEGAVSAWKDPRLYFIGLIVLGMALAEGAANDWLPILMVDEFGFDAASGSLVFLVFATAMTIGRFSGGYFIVRYGRAAVLCGSAVIGAIGLATVIFSHNPILAGAAVLLWGIGASLGFPVALSAAGDSGPNPAERVRLVAICGYVAFLVGPPMLGFVGETYGLRGAMLIVLVLVVTAAISTLALRRPR